MCSLSVIKWLVKSQNERPHGKVLKSEAGGDLAGKQSKSSTRRVVMAFISFVDHAVSIETLIAAFLA